MNNIENAIIEDVSISMEDHGCLSISISVKGDCWGVVIGGWVNGHGYLGSSYWEGNGSAIVAMMKIMDTVGVQRWEDLKGKYIRVKNCGWGNTISEIGNIIEDKWFDLKAFYKADKGQAVYVLDERKHEDEDDE